MTDVPVELVKVTVTEPIVEALWLSWNCWEYWNSDPYCCDAGFEYQLLNSDTAGTITSLSASESPLAAVNWNIAEVISSELEYPMMFTVSVSPLRVRVALVIPGALGGTVMFTGPMLDGVTSCPPAVSVSVTVIVPATVPL